MRRGPIIVAILLIATMEIGLSDAKMGYHILATVDSTSWEINRTVVNTTFSYNNYVVGSGTFQKYSSINGFVGVNAQEQWSSKKGELGFAEQQLLRDREGPVYIKINAQETTIPAEDGTSDQDDSKKFETKSSAEIEVDEYWRAFYGNNKRISYRGDGIRGAERFDNNGDVIETKVDSWKLSRESGYQALVNRTRIKAKITPGNVDVDFLQNRTSVFKLGMSSTGALTHLGVMRQSEDKIYGRISNDIAFSEDYIGQHTMTLNLTMGQSFKYEDTSNRPWLECCYGGKIEGGLEGWKPPDWDEYGLVEREKQVFSSFH